MLYQWLNPLLLRTILCVPVHPPFASSSHGGIPIIQIKNLPSCSIKQIGCSGYFMESLVWLITTMLWRYYLTSSLFCNLLELFICNLDRDMFWSRKQQFICFFLPFFEKAYIFIEYTISSSISKPYPNYPWCIYELCFSTQPYSK